MPRIKQPKYTAADFPPPGSILTFPLADGRFGACQVLRVDIPEGSKLVQAHAVLTAYIGQTPPHIDNPALLRPLLLNHHFWSNTPDFCWNDEPPLPSYFQNIGLASLDKDLASIDSHSFGAWGRFPDQCLTQWRWDHDREALLAEEAATEAEEQKKRAALAERRALILAKTTLPIIQKRKSLLPRWKGHVPAATIRALLAAVIAMKKTTRRDITRELRLCAKALNENGHPIATIERDDIFELFEEILIVSKQPDLIEKLDAWRDW